MLPGWLSLRRALSGADSVLHARAAGAEYTGRSLAVLLVPKYLFPRTCQSGLMALGQLPPTSCVDWFENPRLQLIPPNLAPHISSTNFSLSEWIPSGSLEICSSCNQRLNRADVNTQTPNADAQQLAKSPAEELPGPQTCMQKTGVRWCHTLAGHTNRCCSSNFRILRHEQCTLPFGPMYHLRVRSACIHTTVNATHLQDFSFLAFQHFKHN